MIYPISIKHIANITKKISRTDLRDLIETESELEDWNRIDIIKKFVKDNNLNQKQVIKDLQIELTLARRNKLIMYRVYSSAELFYDLVREILKEKMSVPISPPIDLKENVPIDEDIEKLYSKGISPPMDFKYRDVVDVILSELDPSVEFKLDTFTMATRTTPLSTSMFSLEKGKYVTYRYTPKYSFADKLTRLPITKAGKTGLIRICDNITKNNEIFIDKIIYTTTQLSRRWNIYPFKVKPAFISDYYHITAEGELLNPKSVMMQLETNLPFKIHDDVGSNDNIYTTGDNPFGFKKSVYFQLITWDSIEPIYCFKTLNFPGQRLITPLKINESIEKLKLDYSESISKIITTPTGKPLQKMMLPSSLVWMSDQKTTNTLLEGKMTPENKRFLRMISNKCVLHRLIDTPAHSIKIQNYAEIDNMALIKDIYYPDMDPYEFENFIQEETTRISVMFEELLEVETARYHKGMISLYHCRDLSMKFFDMVSQAFGLGKFNKAKTGIEGTALEKYKQLEIMAFSEYPIMKDFRDPDDEKFQFFDGAPETALHLTSCSYTMFSNFARPGESSIKLLLENSSVSNVKKKYNLIMGNIQGYSRLDRNRQELLKSLFGVFANETSKKSRGSNLYMGQLISIGIPVDKIDDYGYDAYEGGLIKKETSGSIKSQLGSWILSPVKSGITRADGYDINRAQCRLVDIDFNDKELDIQYFEDFPEDISKVYLEMIKCILGSTPRSLVKLLMLLNSRLRAKNNDNIENNEIETFEMFLVELYQHIVHKFENEPYILRAFDPLKDNVYMSIGKVKDISEYSDLLLTKDSGYINLLINQMLNKLYYSQIRF